jgi:hypothetical protein
VWKGRYGGKGWTGKYILLTSGIFDMLRPVSLNNPSSAFLASILETKEVYREKIPNHDYSPNPARIRDVRTNP